MKILLTGGSGLLAINSAIELRNAHEVILGTHNRQVYLDGITTEKINIESIEYFSSTLEKHKPEIVIHTAGLTNVEQCQLNPTKASFINVNLSENIAHACKKNNTKLIYISTDHLFSGNDMFVDELTIPSPINIYAKTKAEAEKKILAIGDDSLIIRTNFYGWGTSYRKSFSDFIIDNIRNNKKINLFNDVYYTPILISTLSKLILHLLNKSCSGIYNVVGDTRLSKYEFGIKVANRFNLNKMLINPCEIKNNNNLVKRPLDMSLSNKKIQSLLNNVALDIDSDINILFEQEKNKQNEEISQL